MLEEAAAERWKVPVSEVEAKNHEVVHRATGRRLGYGALAKGLLYGGGEFLSVHEYKNVQRWTDQIAKRPAVRRGRMVNRVSGDPASQLHERHEASDFDTKTQDKIGEPAKV